MEGQSIADYNESAKVCAVHSDAQSKQLFESLIADESATRTSTRSRWTTSVASDRATLPCRRMSAPADPPAGQP